MTYTVDIRNSAIPYTTEDLLRYAENGLLYCGDTSLSELVEKLTEYYESKERNVEQELDDAEEEAYSRGRSEIISDIMAYLEDL